jgi:hypothetical protein
MVTKTAAAEVQATTPSTSGQSSGRTASPAISPAAVSQRPAAKKKGALVPVAAGGTVDMRRAGGKKRVEGIDDAATHVGKVRRPRSTTKLRQNRPAKTPARSEKKRSNENRRPPMTKA